MTKDLNKLNADGEERSQQTYAQEHGTGDGDL